MMWQAVSQLTPLGARAGQADWAEQAVTQGWMEALDTRKSQGNLLAEARKCRLRLQTPGRCCSRAAEGQAHTPAAFPARQAARLRGFSTARAKSYSCHILVPLKTVASFIIIIISIVF